MGQLSRVRHKKETLFTPGVIPETWLSALTNRTERRALERNGVKNRNNNDTNNSLN